MTMRARHVKVMSERLRLSLTLGLGLAILPLGPFIFALHLVEAASLQLCV